MSLQTKVSSFPTPKQVKDLLPVTREEKQFILESREHAKNLCLKKSCKTALIIGPCSVHHFEATLEYANHLAKLIPFVEKNFFVVMRVFTQKSRSSLGWKGFTYDPFLDSSYDLEKGIIESRKLMIELIRKKIPIASELLDPFFHPYVDDLLCWGFIGARTSLSQVHRTMASSCFFPVGFKNTVEGDIEGAIQGAKVAQSAHYTLGVSEEGRVQAFETPGNAFSHLVLRGSSKGSNFDPISVDLASFLQKKHQLFAPLLIDCSHGNSQKKEERQREGFTSVITQILEGNGSIMGLMLESYLKKGNQPHVLPIDPKLSITDACLSWEESKELVLWAHELLSTKLYCSL